MERRDERDRRPEPLDTLLLGMGEDGPTAPLFPRSEALREEARRVVAVRGPRLPPWRITITPPVIRSARSVLVAVPGAGKADMAARALCGPYRPEEIPAQLARDGAWILDGEAAARLPGPVE